MNELKIIMGGLIVLLIGLAMTGVDCTAREVKTGTIEVWVTSSVVEREASDATPQLEIASIQATVSEIKVYTVLAAADGERESGEWVELYVARRPVDLLQGSGQEQFLAFANVAPTSYSQVLMVVDKLEVTLSGGSKRTIVPNKPFNFIGEFVVFAGQTTTVLFNFNIDTSVTIVEDEAVIRPLTDILMSIRYEEPE